MVQQQEKLVVPPVRNPALLASIGERVKSIVLELASTSDGLHVASSLSVVDILVAVYIGKGLAKSGGKPTERDWLILSKGHAAPALYAVLAVAGVLPYSKLYTIGTLDGPETHADNSVEGVDVSTGSLGQGLSIAAGIAYAMRLDGTESRHRVYVVMGDGELDEGQVWEAASTIAHLGLKNIVAIVDANGYQLDGLVETVKKKSLARRWESLGWRVAEVDGHSYEQLLAVLDSTESADTPLAVIAHTRPWHIIHSDSGISE